MAIKTKSAKAKGRGLQNHVAKLIRDVFELPAEDVKGATMGESGMDIQLSARARSFMPYAIECKSHNRMAIFRIWEQCVANAKEECLVPMAVVKENHKKPLAVIELDHLMKLLEKVNGK